MEVARDFLVSLFRLAQNAVSRGKPPGVRLGLTRAKCPRYFELRNLEDARAFRAELAVAERKGAIAIEIAPRAERPLDVNAISVADLGLLAAHLDLPVRGDQVLHAETRLRPFVAEFPVLDELLERWRRGKKVRGEDPTSHAIDALADAVAVMQNRRGETDEAMLRRVSIDLFGDSKRIEALPKWLDVLTSNDLRASGLTSREIFSELGLHKAPLPFLIAGDVVAVGQAPVQLLQPYMGLPPGALATFHFESPPSCVLTIENLQTFHEFALASMSRRDVVVVFTGGMPSPAWHGMFLLLLRALPPATRLFHFGDIDLGGFRISHAISRTAESVGFRLYPWLMNPVLLDKDGYRLKQATPTEVAQMSELCRATGWHDIADAISACPSTIEQEIIRPVFPPAEILSGAIGVTHRHQ